MSYAELGDISNFGGVKIIFREIFSHPGEFAEFVARSYAGDHLQQGRFATA
jgi:hypothetical protein